MANVFDQFDAAAQTPPVAANVFDQFDEVPNALRSQGLAQNDQTATGPLHAAAMAGANVLAGLGSLASAPRTLADLANIGATHVADWIKGVPYSPQEEQRTESTWLPSAQQVQGVTDRLGLTSNPNLEPRTSGEQYLASISKGIGAAIPFAFGGGLPEAAAALAQGGAGGAGALAASNMFPQSSIAPLFGALAGGVTAGGLASSANRMFSGTSPLISAYERAGVTPRLVGDVSGHPLLQRIQAFAEKSAGAKTIQNAASKTLDEFNNSIDNTASIFGPQQTLQEAGDAIQRSGNNWLKNFKDQSKQNWDTVDQFIPAPTPVSLNNVKNAINTITQSAGGNSVILKQLTGTPVKDMIDVLESTNGSAIPWSSVKALRTKIGADLENPSLVSGSDQAQSKLLYAALTKDMQVAAQQSGPEAVTALSNANAYTAQGHDYIDNVLNGIMNKSPEGAAKSLLSSGVNGGTQLSALREQMPDAADALAAASIRRMGAGASLGSGGNDVSPSKWLSNQDPSRRMSPEAYEALFASPQAQQKMGALDSVAQSMRDTDKFVNHSNTGSHTGMMANIIGAIEGGKLGYEAAGVPGALGGAVLGGTAIPAAGMFAGRLATSPTLLRLMSGSPLQNYGFLPSITSQIPQYAPLPLLPQTINAK
ncbi:MAG: hypothetical protein KGL39_24395 [Patescibacteria group bacterium]|nr:hypothetical protein [Patescibacteria group bacterium]